MRYQLLGVFLMLSIAFCAWAGRSVASMQDQKAVARLDLEKSLRLVGQIEALDQEPQRVSQSADLVEAAHAAAEEVEVRFRSIAPTGSSTKFGNSGYTQDQAVIIADDWTMQQITAFLQVIEQQHPTIRISSLTLDGKRVKAGATQETWGCTITLTQFVASQITAG